MAVYIVRPETNKPGPLQLPDRLFHRRTDLALSTLACSYRGRDEALLTGRFRIDIVLIILESVLYLLCFIITNYVIALL